MIEIAVLVIAGLFTGILGYILGYRRFLIEERFRYKKHKMDELRSFLGGPAEEMVTIVNTRYDLERMSQDQYEKLRKEIREAHSEADRIRPLFVNDVEMLKALTFMGNFTAMKLGKKMTNNLPLEQMKRFFNYRSFLVDRLKQMENELYKPLKWKFWI